MRFLPLLLLTVVPMRAEWVFTGYFGGASTLDGNLQVRQPGLGTDIGFHRVRFSSRSLESPVYFGARAGYFFRRHFGFEGEYLHDKLYTTTRLDAQAEGTLRGETVAGPTPIDSVIQEFNQSQLNYWFANVVGRYDWLRMPGAAAGPVVFSARLGFGPTFPRVESTVGGVTRRQSQYGGVAMQIGAGFELRIYHGLYATIEYKHTRTTQVVGVAGGEVETLLHTNHGVVGLSYHLGR